MKTPPSTATRAISATAIASLIGAGAANARIYHFTDSFTVGNGLLSQSWNIDGVGDAEARVVLNPNHASFGRYVNLSSFYNGFGVIGFATSESFGYSILKFPASAFVGGSISSGFVFGNVSNILKNGNIGNAIGFSSGEAGYIGFQFVNEHSVTCYGWAEVVLTEGGMSGTMTITQWAFEDNGAGIAVGAVPEPSTTAAGLGALALGAAGLRRWRKQKKAA